MIINGNSIPGIFLFDENAEVIYEKGDFVVKGQNLYICKSEVSYNSSGDIDSFFSNNFTLYLGGEKATWEDFKDRYTANLDTDPIITCDSLVEILKKTLFGIDCEGVITGSVDISGYSDDLVNLLDCPDNSNIDILDQIILIDLPEFNNIMFKVDRNLFKAYLPIISEGSQDEDNNVILKQYTYRNNNYLVRVQEVIDYYHGVCLYRYCKRKLLISSNTKISVSDLNGISYWKINCANTDYLAKLNAMLIEYYKSLDNTETNNFHFKKLEGNLSGDNKIFTITTGNPNLSDTTLTILYTENESVWKSNSMTVNFTESYIYEFTSGIQVKKGNEDNTLEFTLPDNIMGFKVQSIYIKES